MQGARSLDPLKRLLWTELNYDRVNESIPMRGWPDSAEEALAEAPIRLAENRSQFGVFHVIYCRLKPEHGLRVMPQRPVISTLLAEYPHALYIFSDYEQKRWHFVNVKYDRDAKTRRLFRRISIQPGERLRTATERIAMLDLASISGDLFGLSPLAIQQRHDEAFDVAAVTNEFFRDYRQIFEEAEAQITGIDDREDLRLFTQKLFNRLMFIIFLERKGWLEFNGERGEYLRAVWRDYQREKASRPDANFYDERLKHLFFNALNNPANRNISAGKPYPTIGKVPYLNGGLFERGDYDKEDSPVHVPDAVIGQAIERLFYAYNFTVTESTPLDIEVAVDPEMLGRVFEELVTGRHESGSYYTPKPVVSFMAREAIKGYLQAVCPAEDPEAIARFVDGGTGDRADAGDLHTMHDPSGIRDAEGVLDALRRVTICDPACGSGAYLLGMLRELFDLREALFFRRKLDARSAYARKLEIIQRNLYGVDIDPFAVNIARLRLWLSLIVEYEGQDPPPLPNLDFKIEVGDSVLGADPSEGLGIDMFRRQEIDKYLELKAAYLQAHGGEKLTLREQIAAQKAKIAEWTDASERGFDWMVEFAEVFAKPKGKSGFDVVITNPPYVRQELIRDIKPHLKKVYGSKLYSGTADLYVYFYYRGLQLLRDDGMLTYISSNKWMRAGYGKNLRQHLKDTTTVQHVIDFGDLPVFTATAYPCIVVLRKAKPAETHTFSALEVDDIEVVERIAETVSAEAWQQPQESVRPVGWTLARPEVLALLQKLRAAGLPLRDYVGGEFYYGIKTGLNAAFVIDERTRGELIAADPRSADVIKPWLRGRDVKRWAVEWDGLYVIFTRRGIDIDQYPAIKAYLAQYRERLEPGKKGGRKPGSYKWYEIRASVAYYEKFDKPKIVYPLFNYKPNFALESSGALSNDNTYIIPGGSLYLLGVLNAHTSHFLLKNIAPAVRGDYIEFRTIYVGQVPIPEPTSEQQAAIEAVVQQLLEVGREGPEVSALEAELNRLVYEVYGLTEDEIAIIEREVGAQA